MSRLMAVAFLLTALTVSGCSDEEASQEASKKEFCRAFHDLLVDAALGPDAGYGTTIKKQASELEELGVPDDMREEAHEGLKIYLGRIAELDNEATSDDFLQPRTNTREEQLTLDALGDYTLAHACTAFAEVRTPAPADPSR